MSLESDVTGLLTGTPRTKRTAPKPRRHAKCHTCCQQMSPGSACCHPYVGGTLKGKKLLLQRKSNDDTGNCHDCNAAPGKLHHSGCDWERCPNCNGQAIGCDCGFEPEFYCQTPGDALKGYELRK